jgi:hypothetical protein
MATRARRLAFLAAAAAATLAFSGCHDMLLITLGSKKDPPVHHPPPAGRTAGADAAAGRPFTGRADGDYSWYKLRHGFVKTTLKAGYVGDYKSDLTGSPLASGAWHARFKAVRNRATGRVVTTGLVLSDFTDTTAGRACLKVSERAIRKQNRRHRLKRARGKVTVVGGEGDASTLYGTARARIRLKRNGSARLSGRMRSHRGVERGFTRACTRLERKFGLQPLPD